MLYNRRVRKLSYLVLAFWKLFQMIKWTMNEWKVNKFEAKKMFNHFWFECEMLKTFAETLKLHWAKVSQLNYNHLKNITKFNQHLQWNKLSTNRLNVNFSIEDCIVHAFNRELNNNMENDSEKFFFLFFFWWKWKFRMTQFGV